jgi:hypothetical protein
MEIADNKRTDRIAILENHPLSYNTWSSRPARINRPVGARKRCGLLSAKGGVMGTKKVGAFPSPHKKAKAIVGRPKQEVKKKFL